MWPIHTQPAARPISQPISKHAWPYGQIAHVSLPADLIASLLCGDEDAVFNDVLGIEHGDHGGGSGRDNDNPWRIQLQKGSEEMGEARNQASKEKVRKEEGQLWWRERERERDLVSLPDF